MTTILGLNAFHADSSACLLRDGKLVAAVEEERFQRVKHWAGLPVESIRYCLDEAGISIQDVTAIAINSDPGANLRRKIWYALTRQPNLRVVLDRITSRGRRQSLPKSVAQLFGDEAFGGKVHFVEHHLAHLAAAFFCSPFDRAVAVSIDGSGDFATTAWGFGEQNRLETSGRVHFPHSLGIFYETITHHLGFKEYGDEYKIMGLASYGEPSFLAEMEKIVAPNTIIATIPFGAGTNPYEVAFSWDSSMAWIVENGTTNQITEVNVATSMKTGRTLTVGTNPLGIAIRQIP